MYPLLVGESAMRDVPPRELPLSPPGVPSAREETRPGTLAFKDRLSESSYGLILREEDLPSESVNRKRGYMSYYSAYPSRHGMR